MLGNRLNMLYLSLFLCVFKDDSRKMVEGWREMLEVRGISLIISGHNSAQPKGGQASLQLLVTVPASQPVKECLYVRSRIRVSRNKAA